jgi:hypothetical protein
MRYETSLLFHIMNLSKSWTGTPYWFVVVLATIMFASVGLMAHSAFADDGQYTQKNNDDSNNYTKNWDESNQTSTSQSGGEVIVNYTGTGATTSTLVNHNLGVLPTVIYILDLTNPPSASVDGITTIISTPGIVYVESGNDAYAPVSLPNTGIVNSTTIDVGQIFGKITSENSDTRAVNYAGTQYELIALGFGSTSGSTSHTNDDDDDYHNHH